MGNEKRRKREHSKEKRFLRQDWAETVSRLQQGSPRTKKKSSRSPETLFHIRCKVTDYLKNIGNRYLLRGLRRLLPEQRAEDGGFRHRADRGHVVRQARGVR